jgi:acetyl-CoA acetyltransferase
MKKGDIGPYMHTHNTRYDGETPMNTDGGQLSAGQLTPTGASGSQQIMEAVRQIRGEAESQVARHDLGLTNH